MPPSPDCLRLPSADISEGGPKRNLGTEALSRAEPRVRIHLPPAASLLRTPALGDGVRGSTAEGSRRGDKDDQAATRSSHGVGTPIDFNRACAGAARAFIPSRCVLTSFPGRFSTLHPSCQYSSICASVSADPRASLPCALHAAAIRRTAALNFGCSRSR